MGKIHENNRIDINLPIDIYNNDNNETSPDPFTSKNSKISTLSSVFAQEKEKTAEKSSKRKHRKIKENCIDIIDDKPRANRAFSRSRISS